MQGGKSAYRQMNWVGIILLAFSGATIYMMPYARGTFYDALMESLNITNIQLGTITSFFGLLTLICYFPGGWLADRFSAKKLLMTSFIANALLGVWYSRLPGFGVVVFIHVLLGVFCTLTFWAAYIKATRLCAPPEAQARAFGFVEGIRRVISMGISLVGAWILASYAADQQVEALKTILLFYAGCNAAVAVGLAVFMKDEDTSTQAKTGASLADIVKVAKVREVWLIAAIIMMAYTSYRSQDVMTPYSTNLCGLTGAVGAMVASIRYYGMGFGAILGGLVGDKLGSANTMSLGFGIIIITNMVFLLVPGTPQTLFVFVTMMLTFMLAHFAMRGVYYALLNEGKVAVNMTGVATGIIATMAYSPDMFAPLYQGALLDAYGKDAHTGYNYIFMISIGAAVIGIILCQIFKKAVARKIVALEASGATVVE